jgi:hypothetical protein
VFGKLTKSGNTGGEEDIVQDEHADESDACDLDTIGFAPHGRHYTWKAAQRRRPRSVVSPLRVFWNGLLNHCDRRQLSLSFVIRLELLIPKPDHFFHEY